MHGSSAGLNSFSSATGYQWRRIGAPQGVPGAMRVSSWFCAACMLRRSLGGTLQRNKLRQTRGHAGGKRWGSGGSGRACGRRKSTITASAAFSCRPRRLGPHSAAVNPCPSETRAWWPGRKGTAEKQPAPMPPQSRKQPHIVAVSLRAGAAAQEVKPRVRACRPVLQCRLRQHAPGRRPASTCLARGAIKT